MQSMAAPISVLVTGSAGRVGSSACEELSARGHRVRGLDLTKTVTVDDAVVGDISDAEVVRSAMDGIEVLVHLAAIPTDGDFMAQLLPGNIIGLYNVLEAAREAGVRRAILASSGQAVSGHQGPWPATEDMAISPRNWYAATKIFAEAAGQVYAYHHGMSVIVVRLGWCPRTKRCLEAIARSDNAKDQYFSPGDAGRFFACAVEAPEEIKYSLLFAMSKPFRAPQFDIGEARRLIGYEAQDRWPEGTEVVKE